MLRKQMKFSEPMIAFARQVTLAQQRNAAQMARRLGTPRSDAAAEVLLKHNPVVS